MHIVVVAHAPELDLTPYLALIDQADLLIAADGGAQAVLRANRRPDLVLGDLDSLEAASEAALVAQQVPLEHFPRDKDETDLELALLAAIQRGATEIDVLGALGGRWDHTFANLALLAHPALEGRRVWLRDNQQTLFLVRDAAALHGQVGDTVSLLPLTPIVEGVTTRGLRYRLDDATLRFEQARGVSNVLLEPPGQVAIRAGLLLVVQHDDGGAHQWNAPRRR